MPLIIAVLIVVVVVSSLRNSSKESKREERIHTANSRKTNAKKERLLVDAHMKAGEPFDRAFELARQDIVKAGFEPCIPKTAYKSCQPIWDDLGAVETSECPDFQRYDSNAVRLRREEYKTRCRKAGRKHTEEGEEAYVYGDDFPDTAVKYARYLNNYQKTHQIDAVPVGRYISYRGIGTCEVTALDFDKAEHEVRVVLTGETKTIPFGDKDITKI